MTTHEWMILRNTFFKSIEDFQKEHRLTGHLIQHLLSECLFRELCEGARTEWLSAPSSTDPRGSGGYINKHGIRVPNPCCEVDCKGRDLDRFYRNVAVTVGWNDDAVIDAVLADPDNK